MTTLERKLEILEAFGELNVKKGCLPGGELHAHILQSIQSRFDYFPTVVLDGFFTPDQLRAMADWLEDPKMFEGWIWSSGREGTKLEPPV